MKQPRETSGGPVVRPRKRGRTATARVAGVADVSIAEQLHRKATELADSGKDVVVTLKEAVRLDASALQVLLALREELSGSGKNLSLSGVPQQIRGYLELAGVSCLFPEHAAEAPSTLTNTSEPRQEDDTGCLR